MATALLCSRGQPEAAEPLVAEANSIATRLRAPRLLDRVAALADRADVDLGDVVAATSVS
jgi:hypothetical protein